MISFVAGRGGAFPMPLLILLLLALQAEPAQPNPRAIVRGKVTALESGSPLKRAQVVIRSERQQNETFVATSDATGAFQITLEPGRYRATAIKAGFVTRGYGAKPTSQNSDVLDLRAGSVEDADFSLIRGGVISGAITDEDGAPLPGVRVQALSKQYDLQGQAHLSMKA